MTTRYITIILLLFGLSGLARAQKLLPGKPMVKNYRPLTYGGGLQNWAIVQDKRGVMFIGNRFGVLKYDGIRWNLIELEKKTIGRSMAIDSSGTVYVGGQGEFGYLDRDSIGELQYRPLWKSLPKEVHGFEDVWRIHVTSNGIVFSTVRAVFVLEKQTGQFKVIKPTEEQNLFDRAYFCNNTLFIQEIGKGLLKWENDRLEMLPGGERFVSEQVKEILPYGGEGLLILTFSKGAFLYQEGRIIPWETSASEYARQNLIYSAIQLNDGTYVVGTSERGVGKFDQEGNMISTIDRMDGLFNNTVLSLFEDQTGNLWAGLDQGISYLEINSPFTQIDGNHNLQGTPYTSAFWKGKLYLGTTNGVFQTDQESLFEPLGHPRFDLLPEAKGQAYKLQVIDNQLLLAHHRGGFVIKDNHATPLGGSEGSWMFLELKAFPGYMVGGTYTGLDLFKKDNRGTWKYIRSFPSFTESSRYLEQDKAGNLWVAHGNKGAFKVTFSPDLTSIQEVKQYGAEDGFPSNIFVDVHRVGQKLVFTAEKGCYQYNPDTDRFEPHELLNEIFSADVYVRKLVEDPKGNVWYQAEEEFGVLMVQDEGLKKHLKRVSVQKLSGRLLPGYEHINPNIFKGVLVGTQEGFVYFNPTDYPNPKSQFKSLIRSVEAIGESDSLLIAGTSGQSGKDPYKVPNYFNAFRFKFAAPFYEDVDKMQFSYMLEGFDQGWSEWRNVFQKEYTNLPSGTYTFMVKAKNIYQQESQIGKFTFSVSQPWYKGRGTALGVFFTLVLGIFFFFLSKNRVLEKEKKLLQMEQEKSIRKQEAVLYKQKAQSEREIMALKNEKLQSEIAHKTKELTSSAMHLVQKGEVLLKIKQELEKVRGELSGPTKGRMTRLIKTIDDDIKFDKNWEKFEYHFDSVHENFLKLLREQYPNLTPKDQKMCAYLRMNLSTKEIAPLMNISVRGVEISRYRLRKKLDLDTGTNLVEFLQQLKPKNPDS